MIKLQKSKNVKTKHTYLEKDFKVHTSDDPWDYIYLQFENHVLEL